MFSFLKGFAVTSLNRIFDFPLHEFAKVLVFIMHENQGCGLGVAVMLTGRPGTWAVFIQYH